MPQADSETHVSGNGSSNQERIILPENPPDFPAESFYLSKEDELDWFDRNVFYERKDSKKTNTSSTHSNSNSQRFSFPTIKSKSSIIGLPKPQNSTFTSCKFRHNAGKPSTTTFFPKRSRSSGKSSVPVTEPSSPKVSCIGRVRSRRQRLRQLSRNKSRTVVRSSSSVKSSNSIGFWGNLKSVLCLRCRENQAVNIVEGSTESPATPKQKSEKRKNPSSSLSPSQTIETPGLSELKRFASGRRFDSLGGGGGGGGSGCNGDLEIVEADSGSTAGPTRK